MRPLYDDFDEFEFDDSAAVKHMLRELQREEVRMASRRRHGPGVKKRWDDDFEDDDYDDFEDYEDVDEYDDYDDDEFDSYATVNDDS